MGRSPPSPAASHNLSSPASARPDPANFRTSTEARPICSGDRCRSVSHRPDHTGRSVPWLADAHQWITASATVVSAAAAEHSSARRAAADGGVPAGRRYASGAGARPSGSRSTESVPPRTSRAGLVRSGRARSPASASPGAGDACDRSTLHPFPRNRAGWTGRHGEVLRRVDPTTFRSSISGNADDFRHQLGSSSSWASSVSSSFRARTLETRAPRTAGPALAVRAALLPDLLGQTEPACQPKRCRNVHDPLAFGLARPEGVLEMPAQAWS